ncbi:hypothetical protein V2W45_1461549 [Cenococcum geophilum]
MRHFMGFVSHSPILQQRPQVKLDSAFPGSLDANWVSDSSIVEKLPILNALLPETMRVRPTSSTGLKHVTLPGGKEIAGRFISRGTFVSVSTVNIHNNPNIYSVSPKLFNIDR